MYFRKVSCYVVCLSSIYIPRTLWRKTHTHIIVVVPVVGCGYSRCVCGRAGRVRVCRCDEAWHDGKGTVGGQQGLSTAIQRGVQRCTQGGLHHLHLLLRDTETSSNIYTLILYLSKCNTHYSNYRSLSLTHTHRPSCCAEEWLNGFSRILCPKSVMRLSEECVSDL